MSLGRPVGLAVGLLLATGCGGDDATPSAPDPAYETVMTDPAPAAPPTEAPDTTSPSQPDPCDLVAKDEAEAVAGTALGEASASEASCTYTGPTTGPLAQFEVYVGPGARKFMDIDVSLGHDFNDLPGIGDQAMIEDGAVFLRVGETWVALRVTRLDELSVYRDVLVALAQTVAGRL